MSIDNFLASDPLSNDGEDKTEQPTLDPIDRLEQREDVQYKANVTKAVNESPDHISEVETLSKRYNRPRSFIENNIDSFRAEAKKEDFLEFKRNNPIAAARALETNKLGMINDDLEKMNKISSLAKRYRFAPDEPTVSEALGIGFKQIKNSATLLTAMQTGDRELIESYARGQKEIQDFNNKYNEIYGDYAREMRKESEEVTQAKNRFFRSLERDAEESLLQQLADIGGSTFDLVSEASDVFISAVTNPKATFIQTAQSAPNSVAPYAVAIPLALAGAKAGAVAGAPLGIPGIAIGVGGGFTGGLLTGRLSSGVALEYMGSVQQQLAEEGYDLSNPDSIEKALQDKEFIAEVKAGALRSGLTVASVETLFEVLGGKLISKALKGPGVAKKVGGAVAGVGVEAGGEGAGATLAPAAEKKDVKEIDVAGGVQEGVAALFMMGGGQALSLSALGVTKSVQAVNSTYEQAKDAKDFNQSLVETVEAINESKTGQRDPELMADILNNTADGQAVYFQAEDFKNHWENLGENAVDKADELLPGGRRDLNQSLEEGSALRIPLGDLVTKFSKEESFQDLARLARKSPVDLNALEADSFTGSLNNIMRELSKQAKEELNKLKQEQDFRQAVENDLEAQLIEAGMSAKEAKKNAMLSSSFFNAVGKRALNEDALTFYQRQALNIKGFKDLPDSLKSSLFQADGTVRLALREGETVNPEFEATESFPILDVSKAKKSPALVDKQGFIKEQSKRLLADFKANTPVGEVSVSDQAIENFFKRSEERTPREGRQRTVKKAKAKFVANMAGLKNIGSLLENATHVSTQADGTQSLYAVAKTEEDLIGIKFDVKDGVVNDLEIVSEQRSEGAARREGLEDATSDAAPSTNINLTQFKKLINTGRRVQGTFFQQDSDASINKINQDSLGFYSKLGREIGAMDFKSMPAKDLANRIKKIPGIKQEELEATGILDLLEATEGKISKEDVLKYIEGNGLQFEEVVKTESSDIPQDIIVKKIQEIYEEVLEEEYFKSVEKGETPSNFYEYDDDEGGYIVYGPQAKETDRNLTEEEAVQLVREYTIEGKREYAKENEESLDNALELEALNILDEEGFTEGPKYSSYTMPGGENYREVLLRLPQKDGEYTSSHWDESNVLAFFRLKDRTDKNGNKTLFIEEIQSDWHQEGRKKGYKGEGPSEQEIETLRLEQDKLRGEKEEIQREIELVKARQAINDRDQYQIEMSLGFDQDIPLSRYDTYRKNFYEQHKDNKELQDTVKLEDSFKKELEELDSKENTILEKIGENRQKIIKDSSAVPDAPFKATDAWAMVAFKRVLRMAVEQGYDSVSWTPGQVQADRYDLSKKIDKIVYMKTPAGYTVVVEDIAGRNVFNKRKMTPDDLEEVIGKELTQKIVDDEGKATKDIEGEDTGFKEISGEGLQVGGEGMKGFYDNILPKAVSKYISKLDKKAKLRTVEVDTSLEPKEVATYTGPELNTDEDYERVEKSLDSVRLEKQFEAVQIAIINGYSFKEAMEREASPALAEAIGGKLEFTSKQEQASQEVWSLPITDKIVEKVSQGQPLFQKDGQKGPRGFTDFSEPNNILIGLLEGRNKSTAIHELGHAYLKYLEIADIEMQSLDASTFNEDQKQFREDINTLLEFLEATSLSELDTQHHEKFARSFEAYAMEGRAPSERLKRAFHAFKTWLVDIYRNIVGLEDAGQMEIKLDDNIREMFDRMLATEEEINEANRQQGYEKDFLDNMFANLTTNEDEISKLYNAHEDAKIDAEQELYKQQLEKMRKKKTREYNKKAKELKEKYEQEAKKLPVYRAIETIKNGIPKDPDVEDAINFAIEDGGLDKALFEKYGISNDQIERLEKKYPGMFFEESKLDIPEDYATIVRKQGKILTNSLTDMQRRKLRENGVANIYGSTGKPVDIMAAELQEEGLVIPPGDRDAVDYLLELLYNNEKLPQETIEDMSTPVDHIEIMSDAGISNEEDFVNRAVNTLVDKVTPLKINTAQVEQALQDKDFQAFPRSLYSSEGMDANLVAELTGYPNGAMLIEDIAFNPGEKKFVELSVQRDMEQLFPETKEDSQALKLEALDEIDKPDSRKKALKMELDILLRNSPEEAKKIYNRFIKRAKSDKETKKFAHNRVSDTTFRQATPAQFRILENKARNNKAKAATEGDFETAIKEATREIFAYEMLRDAGDRVSKIDKSITKNKQRLGRKSDKELSKIGSLDMMKVAQTILARFDILTDTQVDRLDIYLNQLQNYDPDSFAKVSGLVTALIDIEPQNYRDLTVEQVEEVLEVVDSIYDLAKAEKELSVDGKKVSLEEALTDLKDTLSKVDNKTVKKEDSKYAKFKNVYASLEANMTRVEHLINNLDMGDMAGAFRKYLFNRANDAQTFYQEQVIKRFETMNAILDEHFKGVIDDATTINLSSYFPNASLENRSIKRSELIMALLHSGNESNKKKLLLGRGWGIETMEGELDSSAYDRFINDMFNQGVIDKNVMDGVQKVWDLFEEMKPEIQKTHKEVYGYFFKEIEASPISTPFGEYRGGYAPAITDPLFVEAEASRTNQASTEMDVNRYAFASTPKGFTKERVQAYNKALSLDFAMIRGHVEKAVRFYTIEGAVNDLNKIFKDQNFTDTLFDKNNTWGNEVFRPWIARLATQRTTKPADTKAGREFSKVMNFLRSSANAQLMFLNVKNTLENITDFPVLLARVDRKKLMGGVKRYISDPTGTTNFITENSRDMKLRLENQIFEINDKYNEMLRTEKGFEGKALSLQDQVSKHTYILQQALQNKMEIAGWLGAYDQTIEKGGSHDEAVRYADSTIRTVMGSNRPIDMSSIEVGGALQRLVLTFYSYFLNKGNLARYASKGTKAKTYALAIATPAILSAIFRKTYEDRWDEEEDGLTDDVVDVLLMSQVRFITAVFPGGGTAMRFIEGQFNDKPYDDRLSISPLIGMIESGKGVKNLLTKEELRSRDVRDVLNFFGTFSGFPVGALGRPVGFMIDYEQGKQSPKTPLQFTRGIITGKSGE